MLCFCMSIITIESYQSDLSATALDAALAGLVATQRRCEWLLCRYLADMADEQRFREVGWYSDVLHYARERFDLGVKSTRERVRMGRALRCLPRIEQAFVARQLSYSKVRELTRVATTEDEHRWLELARALPMRELERRVARQVGDKAVTDEPARVRWRTPETGELNLHLPARAWALVSRAMQAARQVAEYSMSDAEALEAVANQALAGLCQPDATSVADPTRAVVLYRCRDCGVTELETTAGAVALPPDQADQLSAGAKVVDLAVEGREGASTGGTMPAAVRRAVLARDRGRCRLCGRGKYVDIHHLTPQSQGGEHSRENCAVLCGGCHGAVHDGKVQVKGNAEAELRWLDPAGHELNAHNAPIGGSAAMLGPPLEDGSCDAPIGGSAAMLGPPLEDGSHDAPIGGSAAMLGPPLEDGSHDAPIGGSHQQDEVLSADAARVLEAMGGRGGWWLDRLIASTGLGVGPVGCALVELALARKVEEGPLGFYSPEPRALRSGGPFG